MKKSFFTVIIFCFLFFFTVSLLFSSDNYSIFLETLVEIEELNVGDEFDVYVKFDGKDTNIHSITTLLKWDTTVISYKEHSDEINDWELSAPVYNVFSFLDSHNPSEGTFFWDYAGFNGCSGVVSAHKISFVKLSNKPASLNIIKGNVVSGGFSGSGLMSEGTPSGRFMAIHYDTHLFWDTGIGIQDNLNNVVIYPNPFVPNDNNPLTGSTFDISNSKSGIHIKGLTQNCKIEIYTLLGELVDEVQVSNKPFVVWDAKNKHGRDVASGVYFVLIKNESQSVIKKVAVIR